MSQLTALQTANTLADYYYHEADLKLVSDVKKVSKPTASDMANIAPNFVGDFGTDQLEDCIDAVFVAAQVFRESMADGKVTIMDAFNLPKLIEPVNAVIDGSEDTISEALDLYDAETTHLIELSVSQAESITDDTVTLSLVKQIARVSFGSLTIASIIRRQNAKA